MAGKPWAAELRTFWRWRPGTLGRVGGAGRQALRQCSPGYPRRALLPAVEFFRVFLSHHVEPVCNGSILRRERETKDRTVYDPNILWKQLKEKKLMNNILN